MAGRLVDTTGPTGQDGLSMKGDNPSPEGEGKRVLPLTAWWSNTDEFEVDRARTAVREWVNAAASLAALSRDVATFGVVQFEETAPTDGWDFVASGELAEGYADIAYPHRPKSEWAPEVMVLPVPYDGTSASERRESTLQALVCRARKALQPGGVLLVIAHSADVHAQRAIETAPASDIRRVGRHVLGVEIRAPDVHVRLLQRENPSVARSIGNFETPWLRILRRPHAIYEVDTWFGEMFTTTQHSLLDGRIPRPRAALYDVVGDAVQTSVGRGAEHLRVIHHGDFQPSFFVADEKNDGERWSPQASDLVKPIRRLWGELSRLSKVIFHREDTDKGILWNQERKLRPEEFEEVVNEAT